MNRIEDLRSFPPLDLAAGDRTRQRLDNLTKPRGSLGRLEDLAVQMAEITGRDSPTLHAKVVVVAAGDHGVVEEGVAAYPREVTRQMVENFVSGGAAINCLARLAGARVVVADFGVDCPPFTSGSVRNLKVARGTRNLAREAAMSREECERAIAAGAELIDEEHVRGLDALAIGEMGIGNTTPASCLVAAFTGISVREAVGKGTGLDEAGVERKRKVVEKALALHRSALPDPLAVLAALGGFEIAGLAGAAMRAAQLRVPVFVDGFISSAAALAAARIAPGLEGFLIAAHRSAEPGHAAALKALGLKPLLELEMRLGEGTGAALAFNLAEASVRVLTDMATFGEAGVSDKEGGAG